MYALPSHPSRQGKILLVNEAVTAVARLASRQLLDSTLEGIDYMLLAPTSWGDYSLRLADR